MGRDGGQCLGLLLAGGGMTTRTDISSIESQVAAALRDVACPLVTPARRETAHTELVTFVAVALRVMSRAEPWEVQDAARTTEIAFRMPEVLS